MNDHATIRRKNRALLKQIARELIVEFDLESVDFEDENLMGRTIYDQLAARVMSKVENMTPRHLGEIAACGRGRPVGQFRPGERRLDVSLGTTLCQTHAGSKFWLDPDWDGETLLRVTAASAIVAEICDLLDIKADCFTAPLSSRERAAIN